MKQTIRSHSQVLKKLGGIFLMTCLLSQNIVMASSSDDDIEITDENVKLEQVKRIKDESQTIDNTETKSILVFSAFTKKEADLYHNPKKPYFNTDAAELLRYRKVIRDRLMKQIPSKYDRFILGESTYGYWISVVPDPEFLDYLARHKYVTSFEKNDMFMSHTLQTKPDDKNLVEAVETSSTVKNVVGATAYHNAGRTGSGQRIVVIDSGVDANHPMLQGRVLAGACFSYNEGNIHKHTCDGQSSTTAYAVITTTTTDTGQNCTRETINGVTHYDYCYHGTQVAAMAVGKSVNYNGTTISGIAPDAMVIPIKTASKKVSPSNSGSNVVTFRQALMEALYYVVFLKQQDPYNQNKIAAVNFSGGAISDLGACDALGFADPSTNKSMSGAISLLDGYNVATIAATGNSNYSNQIDQVSCHNKVIAISATNHNGTAIATSYANNSSYTTVLAPGSDLTVPNWNNTYSVASGTSLATPIVAGMWTLKQQEHYQINNWFGAVPAAVSKVLDSMTMGSSIVKITDSRNTTNTKPVAKLQTGWNYAACSYCKLYIRANNSSSYSGSSPQNFKIYFKTNNSNFYSEDKTLWVAIPINSYYNEISIDLSRHISFTGTVTGIRIDPSELSGTPIKIDNIRFGDYDRWAGYLLSWEFNGSLNGWQTANITNLATPAGSANGYINGALLGTAQTGDPYISININVATGR